MKSIIYMITSILIFQTVHSGSISCSILDSILLSTRKPRPMSFIELYSRLLPWNKINRNIQLTHSILMKAVSLQIWLR